MATWPLVRTETLTSRAAIIAHSASSLPALTFCRIADPINLPIMAPSQYAEMYLAASPKAAW